MTKQMDPGVRILGSLVRKQEWEITELQSGLTLAKNLVQQLSKVIHELESRILETESILRFSGGRTDHISVDTIQRDRKFLKIQHQELDKALHEHQRAQSIEQEFVKKLTELRVQMRVYENLASRKRATLAAEAGKISMKHVDELWLTKRGR